MVVKNEIIVALYKILLLFEDATDIIPTVTETEYLTYLDRLYIRFLGHGNEEIYNSIKGLQKLGVSAEHNSVKVAVFNMIDVYKKGESLDA